MTVSTPTPAHLDKTIGFRFLSRMAQQATFGPTEALVREIRGTTAAAWVAGQMALKLIAETKDDSVKELLYNIYLYQCYQGKALREALAGARQRPDAIGGAPSRGLSERAPGAGRAG